MLELIQPNHSFWLGVSFGGKCQPLVHEPKVFDGCASTHNAILKTDYHFVDLFASGMLSPAILPHLADYRGSRPDAAGLFFRHWALAAWPLALAPWCALGSTKRPWSPLFADCDK